MSHDCLAAVLVFCALPPQLVWKLKACCIVKLKSSPDSLGYSSVVNQEHRVDRRAPHVIVGPPCDRRAWELRLLQAMILKDLSQVVLLPNDRSIPVFAG